MLKKLFKRVLDILIIGAGVYTLLVVTFILFIAVHLYSHWCMEGVTSAKFLGRTLEQAEESLGETGAYDAFHGEVYFYPYKTAFCDIIDLGPFCEYRYLGIDFNEDGLIIDTGATDMSWL